MPSTDNVLEAPAATQRRRSFFQFSLRTLLIYVFIVATLLGAVVLVFRAREAARRNARTRMAIMSIGISAEAYYVIWQHYPPLPASGTLDVTVLNVFNDPLLQPGSGLSTFQNGELLDGWGNPYHVKVDGKTFRVWSSGPNGIDENGQGDDIQ